MYPLFPDYFQDISMYLGVGGMVLRDSCESCFPIMRYGKGVSQLMVSVGPFSKLRTLPFRMEVTVDSSKLEIISWLKSWIEIKETL